MSPLNPNLRQSRNVCQNVEIMALQRHREMSTNPTVGHAASLFLKASVPPESDTSWPVKSDGDDFKISVVSLLQSFVRWLHNFPIRLLSYNMKPHLKYSTLNIFSLF